MITPSTIDKILDTCLRCGRSDGQHSGYHESVDLPIKRGDRVRIRAGAEIRTTLPDPTRKRFTLTRSRVVPVNSMDGGRSECIGHAPGGARILRHLDDPEVCWTGTGGYWHHAKLADVTLVSTPAPTVAADSSSPASRKISQETAE